MNRIKYLLIFTFFLFVFRAVGQEFIVKGKVTDAETGEGLPFVTVSIPKTTIGTTTDFDGFYEVKVPATADSLVASYLGYSDKTKAIPKGSTPVILDFQLEPFSESLEEFVVVAGENPAFPIMRNVMKNKAKNDKRNLQAFQFESYNKIEISIDNLSDKFREKKMMKKIVEIFDSLKTIAGEDGKPILPIFMSESLSDLYHRENPDKTIEKIKAANVTGVGIQDGSLVSQLIGSTFQEYNFYKNWISIVEKDFMSPIADGWEGTYDYLLLDSMEMDGMKVYKISFEPKRPQDLAFTGHMYIADSTFALKQIDATIDKRANLNYIEKIKIQQELSPTSAGQWLPSKSRLLIDIAEINDNSPGMLAKFYTSNKKFVANEPKEEHFYDELIAVDEDALKKDDQFWEEARHDTLTPTELNVIRTIDSVKNVPIVKTYVELANIAVNGYKKVGKIDVGPYLYLYANNNIEGHRFRLGFRTNLDFSKNWILKGFTAYGTKDQRFKYGGDVSYMFSRKTWSSLSVFHHKDIDQIGVASNMLENNELFLAFTRFGTLKGPYLSTESGIRFQTDINRNLRTKSGFRHRLFEPLFPFNYYADPENGDSTLQTNFTTSEVMLEARYTRDEFFVTNENERMSLGTKGWPIFTLRYQMGIKGLLNGDFNFHKVTFLMSHSYRIGVFGRSYYDVIAGKVFSSVPYPLLEVHIGNETPFYTTAAFNLMDYYEFISDSYAAIRYRHYFEGLFFNRIPLIRKLKWRFLATSNILFGGLSQKNKDLIIPLSIDGESTLSFSSLKPGIPYAEVGYGIENIFKIFRVDAFHRLTYLNKPGINRFGVKVSMQFTL